jgi:hypothetical protein
LSLWCAGSGCGCAICCGSLVLSVMIAPTVVG